MQIITDNNLHNQLCRVCIENPHSLLSELDEKAKRQIVEATVCISYKKGDIIYENKNGISCVGGKYLGSRKYRWQESIRAKSRYSKQVSEAGNKSSVWQNR